MQTAKLQYSDSQCRMSRNRRQKCLESQFRDENQRPGQNTLLPAPKPSKIQQKAKQSQASILNEHYYEANLAYLTFQYKMSLEYGPGLGAYIMPKLDDYFVWELLLFIRQGYYKDSTIEAELTFCRKQPKTILSIRFVSPTFHPLVDFATGQIDITVIQASKRQDSSLFSVIFGLRQIFLNNKFLSIHNSLNPTAAKTYSKSQVLFAEKVFETTVILSQKQWPGECQFILSEQNELEPKESLLQIQEITKKLKQICPYSSYGKDMTSNDQKGSAQQKVQSKVNALMVFLSNSSLNERN